MKTLDKSAFTQGTVITIEIRSFFCVNDIQPGEHRPVTLLLSGVEFDSYIAMENSHSTRTRLFWNKEFTAELAKRFPSHSEHVKQDKELDELPPAEMTLTREQGERRFAVSLAEGDFSGNEWTDEELEETVKTVKAYLWMLDKKTSGKPYNKAEVNRNLPAEKLRNRISPQWNTECKTFPRSLRTSVWIG